MFGKAFSILFLINTLLLSTNCYAQSVGDLKKEKEKTSKEIEFINNLLKETNSNTKSSLSRLSILEKKLKLQSKLINNINSEIGFLDSTIMRSSNNYDSLDSDLRDVKNRYAKMIQYAQRIQNTNNRLLFYFSAENFNQAYKRFVYLKQYADYRRIQAEQIETLKNSLDLIIVNLNEKKSEKLDLLNSKVYQAQKFEDQKKEQMNQVSALQKKERDLKKKLENQKLIATKLQNEIEKIIAEEVNMSKPTNAKDVKLGVIPRQSLLSSDFSKNKGILPWPVMQGLITDHFGEHPHLVLKHVITRNAGIDITTQAGSRARSVFKGEVSKVIAIPGGNMAVIIRHGSYLTVYSNLVNISVQTGQKIDTKQDIGTVYTDKGDDNKTVLKFQLWFENNKLDPEQWIAN